MNDFKRNDRFGGKRQGGGFSKPGFQRPGGGFSRPQGQMYPATCAQCGKPTEVPFRPDGQRPIYCRDCFGGKDTAPARSFQKPTVPAHIAAQPKASPPDPRIDVLQRQLTKIEEKLDGILLGLAVAKAQATVPAPAPKKKKPAKKK